MEARAINVRGVPFFVIDDEYGIPGIREFPLTLECRVLYQEEQDASKLPEEIRRQFYSIETSEHTAFYGEIVTAYIIE